MREGEGIEQECGIGYYFAIGLVERLLEYAQTMDWFSGPCHVKSVATQTQWSGQSIHVVPHYGYRITAFTGNVQIPNRLLLELRSQLVKDKVVLAYSQIVFVTHLSTSLSS